MCLKCSFNQPSFCVSDMTNAATFRDLSKPVGALNKERLDRLLVSLFTDVSLFLDRERPWSSAPQLLSKCRDVLLFTGSLQRHAWTSLHVRQSLLLSRLRPLLPGQSWYVAHFNTQHVGSISHARCVHMLDLCQQGCRYYINTVSVNSCLLGFLVVHVGVLLIWWNALCLQLRSTCCVSRTVATTMQIACLTGTESLQVQVPKTYAAYFLLF